MNSRFGRLVAAALFVALPFSSLAVEPWEEAPFTAAPAKLRAAADKLPPPAKADVEVLLEEVDYTFDAQRRLTQRRRLVYRVLTAQGARAWATTGDRFQPWHEARPEFRARVVTAAGAVHDLDPATLSEQGAGSSSPDTFSDARMISGPLPAIEVGALVEEQILSRETSPFFSKGSVYRVFLGKNVPVRRTVVRLSLPDSAPLQFQVHGTRPQVSDRRERGTRTVVFEYPQTPALEASEPFTPHEASVHSHVAFSTAQSWKEVASEYARIVDQQLKDTDLQPLAKTLFGDTRPSREAALRAVIAWQRKELRYTGVEFGEAALVPRSPAEVLTRKYGDCKDLATLVVGLLRTQGIDAQVALLRTRWDEVPDALPGFGLFDHAIVHVPGKPALWLDATTTVYLVGEVPPADQGRLALIASAHSTKLVRIPETPPSAHRLEITREVHLAESGPARLVEHRQAFGSVAADYRQTGLEGSPQQIREWYEGWIQESYGGKQLTRFDYPSDPSPEQPFTSGFELADAAFASTQDQEVKVTLQISGLISMLPEGLARVVPEPGSDQKPTGPRTRDFVFGEPFESRLTFRVFPPLGFTASAPPSSEVRQLGPAQLSRKVTTAQDGEVTVDYRFTVGKRRYTAAEVETFRDAFSRWGEEPQDQLTFVHQGKQLLSAGKVKEALESYHQVAQRHPKEALHQLHLASALLEAGFGEEARVRARQAVALEPKSAEAHQTLGWILQHDTLGRRFRHDFDLQGALASYRTVRQLGGSFEARGDLAILLEHNELGVRYGKGAQLDAAIAEYRALAKDLDRHELDENLLYALMWADRFAELKSEVEASKERSLTRTALKLVAVAALEGAPAAIAEVQRLEGGVAARRKALGEAANQLVRVRRYPEAAALLSEAVKGSPQAAQEQRRISLLGRFKRHEQLAPSAKDPKGAVQQIMIRSLDPAFSVEQLGALFARPVLEGTSAAKVGTAMRQTLGAPLRKLAEQQVSFEVAADSGLAATELSEEGSPEVGYRVRAHLPLSNGAQEQWFLIREDGQYRILGTSRTPGMVGWQALRLAKAGKLSAAVRWLNWTRELVHCGGEGNAWNTFCALWPERGSSQDRAELTLAAAAAAALSEKAKEATPLLEEARRTAALELATKIDWTLGLAYLSTLDPAKLEAVADRMLARSQGEQEVRLKLIALTGLERTADAEALVKERLEAKPDDAELLERLAVFELRRGDYAAAMARGEALVSSGRATANLYNELSWGSLAHGRVDARMVEYAQRATSLVKGPGQRAFLHTLASLNAEVGKNLEARQVLLNSVELREDDAPDPADWYVIGRIAENYGLLDAARAAYGRALPDRTTAEKFRVGSVELLAKTRMERLPGGAAVAGPTPP